MSANSGRLWCCSAMVMEFAKLCVGVSGVSGNLVDYTQSGLLWCGVVSSNM